MSHPGTITIEATVDVFTGKPLVVLITEGDSDFIGSVVNLPPDEAERMGRKMIVCADEARKKV